jgi:hypothetical protein
VAEGDQTVAEEVVVMVQAVTEAMDLITVVVRRKMA